MQAQIKNRLAYISQEKEKKSQAVEQLKKKYEKLLEVRKKSVHEKEYLRKVELRLFRKRYRFRWRRGGALTRGWRV